MWNVCSAWEEREHIWLMPGNFPQFHPKVRRTSHDFIRSSWDNDHKLLRWERRLRNRHRCGVCWTHCIRCGKCLACVLSAWCSNNKTKTQFSFVKCRWNFYFFVSLSSVTRNLPPSVPEFTGFLEAWQATISRYTHKDIKLTFRSKRER